jgi:uncharacterized protein (TIGR00251 family)
VAHSTSSVDLPGPAYWAGKDLLLRVQLLPRANCDEFAGIHDNALKIRLTAPPVDGRANAALIAFLAEEFGVAKQQVALLRGKTSRTKKLRIQAPSRIPPWLLIAPAHLV